jgi:hypothetical protein
MHRVVKLARRYGPSVWEGLVGLAIYTPVAAYYVIRARLRGDRAAR